MAFEDFKENELSHIFVLFLACVDGIWCLASELSKMSAFSNLS